jgi:hypothetical protein
VPVEQEAGRTLKCVRHSLSAVFFSVVPDTSETTFFKLYTSYSGECKGDSPLRPSACCTCITFILFEYNLSQNYRVMAVNDDTPLPVQVKREKSKMYPITSYEGREGDWRYSSTLCLTSALNGVGG